MNTVNQLKIGGDPRRLRDYTALRDELAKLAHPARPDINWRRVEQLSLSLFRLNGADLQTASGYTLARVRQVGLSGLNEGLAILTALVCQRWETVWPQSVRARVEILSALSVRLQAALRTLTLEYADLPQVYQAEQYLNALREALAGLELKNACLVEELYLLMHNASQRLEKAGSAKKKGDAAGPVKADSAAAEEQRAARRRGATSPAGGNVPLNTAGKKAARAWKPFFAGMVTALLLGGGGLWGWQALHPRPAPLPAAASTDALNVLAQLPPHWLQRYGFALAASAPGPEADRLKARWQAHLDGGALPAEALSGWHQGMAGLQMLTRRLNELDERKGKYLTGSELKSMVFAITQNFTRAVPAEEQLYQLTQIHKGEPLPAVQLSQTELHLNQLLNRYMLIRQQDRPQ